jgi:hypothetical protein
MIPQNIKTIGDYSFYGCTNLKSITLLNGALNSIGENAFAYCGLLNITIPNSVTRIGNGAFQ